MRGRAKVAGPPQCKPRQIEYALSPRDVEIGVPDFAAIRRGRHNSSLTGFAARGINRFEVSIAVYVGECHATVFVLPLELCSALKAADTGTCPHLRDLTVRAGLQSHKRLRASLHNDGWRARRTIEATDNRAGARRRTQLRKHRRPIKPAQLHRVGRLRAEMVPPYIVIRLVDQTIFVSIGAGTWGHRCWPKRACATAHNLRH